MTVITFTLIEALGSEFVVSYNHDQSNSLISFYIQEDKWMVFIKTDVGEERYAYHSASPLYDYPVQFEGLYIRVDPKYDVGLQGTLDLALGRIKGFLSESAQLPFWDREVS